MMDRYFGTSSNTFCNWNIDVNPNTPEPKEIELNTLLSGKVVSVVGNAPVDKDYSEEIEQADIVLRMNHAYNLPSNMVGKRTDILVLTPSPSWLGLSDDVNGKTTIAPFHPAIVAIELQHNLKWNKVQSVFKGCNFYNAKNPYLERTIGLTLGGKLLVLLAKTCKDCIINLYGYGTSDSLRQYVKTTAYSHKLTVEAEIELRDIMMERIRRNNNELPRRNPCT